MAESYAALEEEAGPRQQNDSEKQPVNPGNQSDVKGRRQTNVRENSEMSMRTEDQVLGEDGETEMAIWKWMESIDRLD